MPTLAWFELLTMATLGLGLGWSLLRIGRV